MEGLDKYLTNEPSTNDDDGSPYCKICDACGITGCCNPPQCQQHPEGDYCDIYLAELKMHWALHNAFMNHIDENKDKYKDLIEWQDKKYDELHDKYMGRFYKLPNQGEGVQVSDTTEAK